MPETRPPLPGMIRRLMPQSVMAKSSLCMAVFFGAMYGSSAAYSAIRTPADDMVLSVNTRLQPDYDPQGIRLNDFTLYPFVSAGLSFNDNVYAEDTNEVEDFIQIFKAGTSVKSDFVRHALNASIGAERGIYRKTASENYTDYKAEISGRIDATGQTSIPLSLSLQHDHIRRDSPDDIRSIEPAAFDLWTAATGIIHKGRGFVAKIIGTFRDYAFDDTRTGLGGLIRNSDRDRNEWSLYSSIGLPEEGYFAPFIYSEFVKINYDAAFDGNGFNRDSHGYEIGAGSIINFSDVTRASFHAGYINREADDTRYSDIGDFTYGVNLVWEPSTLAAFTLSGKRTISETLETGSQGSIVSNIGLSMNYELFPNLLLAPTVDYQTREYEGIDREIERVTGGLDMTYKMNQNLWLTGAYRYITQEESGSRPNPDDFESNVFNLSLKLQF